MKEIVQDRKANVSDVERKIEAARRITEIANKIEQLVSLRNDVLRKGDPVTSHRGDDELVEKFFGPPMTGRLVRELGLTKPKIADILIVAMLDHIDGRIKSLKDKLQEERI